MYLVAVTAASFVAAWLANIAHEPDRPTGLLCLAVALLAGALAWLAETCLYRARRSFHEEPTWWMGVPPEPEGTADVMVERMLRDGSDVVRAQVSAELA